MTTLCEGVLRSVRWSEVVEEVDRREKYDENRKVRYSEERRERTTERRATPPNVRNKSVRMERPAT